MYVLYAEQVMMKTEDSIMAIAVILQHMRNTDDALRVLKHFIGTFIQFARRARVAASICRCSLFSRCRVVPLMFSFCRVCG